MKELKLKYLCGGPIGVANPVGIFDDTVCSFLDDLSKELLKNKEAKEYPDVISFAFFCRKGNIRRLKADYEAEVSGRLGVGFAFHIAPGNVPVNFAFSFVFGLLSGNANVVRISEKEFPQVDIICDAINRVFDDNEKYDQIRSQTAIVRYERDKAVNDRLSELCDVRIVWGGDNTIRSLRESPIGTRCREITFADRYSIGIMEVDAVLSATDDAITSLARDFYNDTYLMDQNACSTPHMIFWLGKDDDEREKAKERFWKAVYDKALASYDLADIKVSDKYVMLCEYAALMDPAINMSVKNYDNLLNIISLRKLPDDITSLRGRYGLFFQYDIDNVTMIAPYINKMVQSCMIYGVESEEVAKMIKKYRVNGIDRIVPFGQSLDIGLKWDGYDLIREMSRVILL